MSLEGIMRRWRLPHEPTPPENEGTLNARRVQLRNEIRRTWDDYESPDAMLSYLELWIATEAPPAVRGQMARPALYALIVEIYIEKYPEDWESEELP